MEPDLKNMIDDGRLPVGTMIYHKWKDKSWASGQVTAQGIYLLTDGKHHNSLSAAAEAAGSTTVNGWQFWRLESGQKLAELRGFRKPVGQAKTSGHAKSRRTAMEVDRIRDPDKGAAAVYVARRLSEEIPSDVLAGALRIMGNPGRNGRNHNGKSNDKRMREIREMKRANGGYGNLIEFQYQLNQLVRAMEAWDGSEHLKLEDTASWKIADVYEDLLVLGEWFDRTLGQVTGWLGENATLAKIAKLRDTRGRTADEADTANRLADRLEAKLANRLTA